MKARTLIPALLITFAASGCATWDNLSSRLRRVRPLAPPSAAWPVPW